MIPVRLSKAVQRDIEKGNTREALNRLGRSKTIQSNPELYESYLHISSQWNTYKRDETRNVNSDEFQQKTLNRINLNILELVDGDLSTLDRIKPKTQEPNLAIRYFIYGLLFILAIFGGMKIMDMISPQPIVIHNPSATTKPILREFKVYILNGSGQTTSTQAVKIYRDLTGEISIAGQKHKITQVTEADSDVLDFAYYNNGYYHYQYMLPALHEIKPGVNNNKGRIVLNGREVGNWLAEEIPSQN